MNISTLARRAAFAAIFCLSFLPGGAALADHKLTAEDWADSLRHVTVNGADFAYLDVGKGEPIVLIHGGSADYRTWLGELLPLSAQYRVIAYSRRYHYPNTGGGDGLDYSIALHERDFAGLMIALHVGKVHLVGHSYGAYLAAQLAADQPAMVRSLVLAEPMFPALMTGTKQDSQFVSEWRLVRERAKQSLMNDFPDLGFQAIAEWTFGADEAESIPRAVRQRLADNARALKLQMLSTVPSAPLGCPQIQKIRCPVLYIEGARSPWHAHAMGDAFVQCRPATQRLVLKNVSHGMVWDDPKAFSKAVLEFLGRSSLASE
jgi:pimeloyl-ACP methyl ester carboxylesterase